MFNRNIEYIIKEIPTDDRQGLQDLLNEMSSQGWDLYTLHEVETDNEYIYSCIFMREKMVTDGEEVYDKVVNVKNFKAQMEKMLTRKMTPYETCKDIMTKIRGQKKQVAEIKAEIEKTDGSKRAKLNEQMSDALKSLEDLKESLAKEISPGVMYSRIGEEKFIVNLSEELLEFVSPDCEEDLLSETVKSRQKLTDEFGYVIPRMIFQDDDTLLPYEFNIKVHNLEVFKSIAVPEHIAFYKEDLELKKKPKNVISTNDIITNKELWWFPESEARNFWVEGKTPVQYIAEAIEFVAVKYVSELLEYNDVNRYISLEEQRNPFLVNNIIPDFISISELKYILVNLIRERISIKDLDYIFEKINDFSDEMSKDGLLDKIRLSLSKHISKRFISKEPTKVFEFSNTTLDKIFLLTETDDETIVKVDGNVAEKIANKIKKAGKEQNIKEIILVVPMEIRHMTFTIFSEFINNITVIAHEELTCDTNIDITAII